MAFSEYAEYVFKIMNREGLLYLCIAVLLLII